MLNTSESEQKSERGMENVKLHQFQRYSLENKEKLLEDDQANAHYHYVIIESYKKRRNENQRE